MSDTNNGHPDARRPKGHALAWINMILLCVIVLCCNYIGCHEYGRKDLTEDQRYTISERTIRFLSSDQVRNRETPIRIVFAFKRSERNYPRMFSLLEEYKKFGNGMIEIECIDPIRQPTRAQEISQIYGVNFNKNICIVDARANKDVPVNTFDDNGSERSHVAYCEGEKFVRKDVLPDGSRRAVALMMDEVLCTTLIAATEGTQHHMYIVADKGGVSRSAERNLLLEGGLDEIARRNNIAFIWLDISSIDRIPDDAEGLLIISPTMDFTKEEVGVLREYWDRKGRNFIFVALSPNHQDTNLPNLYSFLRAQGIRPNRDRVFPLDDTAWDRDDKITARIPLSMNGLEEFAGKSPNVKGGSMSFTLEHGNENDAAMRQLNTYALLVSTEAYYGETSTDRNNYYYSPKEDRPGPLCLQAAVTHGNPSNPNDLSTLMVVGNTTMLLQGNMPLDQVDYMASIWALAINRPEYTGTSDKQDLTVKIDLNRHSRNALETLTLIIMPLLAMLVALSLWNIRRH